MEHRTLDRREFTLQSAMAILSAATITISGCGGGSSPAPSPNPNPNPNPNPGPGDVSGTIAGNHGHTAIIISLDIRGQADHPHTVSLTAAEITTIGAHQQVVKTSSSDQAHVHTVTFN